MLNVCDIIPEVMNALYDQSVFESTSLKEIRDAFRRKQITGKQSLINAIDKHCEDRNSTVLVVGGWFGFTSLCLYKLGFKNITEVDPDGRLEKFSTHLNRGNPSFSRVSLDVNDIDISRYDLIINPSCEHILDNTWFLNISKGSIVVLHSTDYPAVDHPNTCNSLEEMKEKYPLLITISETINLDYYNRFMLIGEKK
jgi:hypothetical protein